MPASSDRGSEARRTATILPPPSEPGADWWSALPDAADAADAAGPGDDGDAWIDTAPTWVDDLAPSAAAPS